MIPVIEATMVKLDIYSRSYAFRAQVNQVKYLSYMTYNLEVVSFILTLDHKQMFYGYFGLGLVKQ